MIEAGVELENESSMHNYWHLPPKMAEKAKIKHEQAKVYMHITKQLHASVHVTILCFEHCHEGGGHIHTGESDMLIILNAHLKLV